MNHLTKFEEFKYERLNIEMFNDKFEQYSNEFQNAINADEQVMIIKKVSHEKGHLASMQNLANIRYKQNMVDEFNQNEQNYWDNNSPYFQKSIEDFNALILSSKFLDELKEKLPQQYFIELECDARVFNKSIIKDLQKENNLVSEYLKIMALANYEIDGIPIDQAELGKMMQSKDFKKRKKAYDSRMKYLLSIESKIDTIFDELVQTRNEMAIKLGYSSFTQMGYDRLHRFDYNSKDIEKLRGTILKYILPKVLEYRKQQSDRIHVENIPSYLDSLDDLDKDDKYYLSFEDVISITKEMYNDLSTETGEFFQMLLDRNLLDLQIREGKDVGGYCGYIQDYQAPFVFSNFNGESSSDITVLTHEVGHAFQHFMARNIDLLECQTSTMEISEVHSTTMEYLTHKYMKNYFDNPEVYIRKHIEEVSKFLIYAATIDEFQHLIYEHPEYNSKKRKEVYRALENKYQPYKNYENCEFLNRGNYWMQQGHIFFMPFYYIDYGIARLCAIQFYLKSLDNFSEAWNDYILLLSNGGLYGFNELLNRSHLKSVFDESFMNEVINRI